MTNMNRRNDVTGDDPILGGRSRAFYFVHSYAVDPDGILSPGNLGLTPG